MISVSTVSKIEKVLKDIYSKSNTVLRANGMAVNSEVVSESMRTLALIVCETLDAQGWQLVPPAPRVYQKRKGLKSLAQNIQDASRLDD